MKTSPYLKCLDNLSILGFGLYFNSIFLLFFFLSKGAEWWAQQLGQSIPLFSWVPFVNGKKISDMLFLQFFLQRYFLDFILKFVF